MNTTIKQTEARHTPGPWRAFNSPIAGHMDIWSLGDDQPQSRKVVCDIGPSDTKWQDAELIASAPSLLFELQRLVTLVRNQDVTITRPNYDIETFLASAVEVITQAKGTK